MKGRARVAWNLRRLRAERGVSQERLAADAAVDRSYVSDLERATENSSVDLLDRLAAVLECGIEEFFVIPPEGAERPKALKSGRKSSSGYDAGGM